MIALKVFLVLVFLHVQASNAEENFVDNSNVNNKDGNSDVLTSTSDVDGNQVIPDVHEMSSEQLEDEISSSLDELIRLQQLKLDYLMKNRAKSGGSANGMVNKRPSVEQNVNAPPPSENSPQYKPHESQIFEALPFESYLAPRLSLELNFSVVAHHVLEAKTIAPQNEHPRDVLLILLLDASGILHIFDEYGAELQHKNLNLFHKSQVLTTDVEPYSEIGPIFVSGSRDGSVNVLSIMVEHTASKLAVTVAEVSFFSVRIVQKRKHNDIDSSSSNVSLPYPTSLHLYNRGSDRGVGIYVGDSYCRFTAFMLNGTVIGRVGITSHSGGFGGDRSSLMNEVDLNECGPGEEGGIAKMSRIGQVMAVPIGNSVALLHIARLHIPPRFCKGVDENIIEVAFDVGSMSYLMAVTRSGGVLTFNTKARDNKNKEARCILMRATPGFEKERPQGSVLLQRSVASLRGYVVTAGATASSGCQLSILNTSSIKKQREGRVVASKILSPDCSKGSASIGVSPKNLRDHSRRWASQLSVSAAYNLDFANNKTSMVHIYTSLLPQVEVEDEFAWLKWPMTIGGVVAFLLYKLYGTNRKPKPNTAAGTYSKYAKYSNRFGSNAKQSEDLTSLRDKISSIESSINELDSSGIDLLKRLSAESEKRK